MTANKHSHQELVTGVDYIDSIKDPFFKSIAQQTVATKGAQEDNNNAGEKEVTAKDRLEDLEVSVRKKLLKLLLTLQESGDGQDKDDKSASDTVGIFWKSTLDLCHHIVHNACLPSSPRYENLMPCRRLPYLLLSDCLEGLPTLEDAKCFWGDYVEPELSLLFADKFWSQLTESNNRNSFSLPSSHLPFLKVANQFLKRLEHASETRVRVEWKGRIMWALSKGFSIADKSSLKLWGNFHTSNGTDFESKEEFENHTTVGVSDSTTTTNTTVEYNLYEAFWSLQNDFSNPNKINVADFIKRLRLILAAMESASATKNGNRDIDRPTTKYLTSSALLPSQIQDPAFRSSVVTQFLIVASHLGAESPPLKNALASLLGRARKLLKKDNPQLHGILWESILASGREDHWRTWKKQKCAASAFAPSVEHNLELVPHIAVVADDDRNLKRRRLTKEEENGSVQEEIVSSIGGNFLNNNGLSAEAKDTHHKMPTLEEHLEPYVEALDPESGIEDEYHPKNDSLFTWRAMRLYAKHQLPLMSQCRKPGDLEKITRQWYRESHGKDIPGELPTVEEPDDNNDIKTKEETDSADDHAGDDQNGNNEENDSTNMDIDANEKSESTNTDTDMKGNEIQEEEQKQVKEEKNEEDIAPSKDDEKGTSVKVENTEKQDGDEQNADNAKTKSKSEEKESPTTKEENSAPTKESTEKTESSVDGKSTKSKTGVSDEQKLNAKNTEASKRNTSTDNGKTGGDRKFEKNRNNKNDSQRQEKRPPRENLPPPNRGGGRRGNDGGRNVQDRGRRDDGPPPRRRADDNHQSRGGRPGGDSYRGRSDGPPPRGGRYDDDYRGDNSRHQNEFRGDRFGGDRSNRSSGRDNQRGGDRGGGSGRDDYRGGRPRDGGGGRRRR